MKNQIQNPGCGESRLVIKFFTPKFQDQGFFTPKFFTPKCGQDTPKKVFFAPILRFILKFLDISGFREEAQNVAEIGSRKFA